MDWSRFPKVELHLHLDCSLSYEVVSHFDPSITPEQFRLNFICPDKSNLEDYLKRAPNFFPFMQTEEQLSMVTLDLFNQIKKDNMLYAEIRFAPLLHTRKDLSPEQVVSCVEKATAQAVHRTGVEARIILCTLRYFSTAQSLETVHLVEDFRGTYVAGFDIAADRPGNVFDDHIPAFRYARDRDIPYTAHSGETRGPDNVWDTVKQFAPSRMGHGVPCLEYPELVDYILENKIHLELCPTSNIQTNTFDTYEDHQIDKLYRLGLSVGVNTDSRTISNVTLNEEYEKMHRTFGWEPEDFFNCNKNALEAAFISNEVRDDLMERLVEGYQKTL